MKSYYCLLEKFNNYFNRKVIKYDTLAEYTTNSNASFIPLDSQGNMVPFDFNPNDNVTTEIIVDDVTVSPDYFLEIDESQNILSRWFVLEVKRNRQGQWVYYLKRDVISDNVDALMTAPVFVQKGIVGDDNPLVLNSEGMSFNQIKTEETLLKDKTTSSWLVAYIAKSAGGADVNIQVPASDVEGAISLSTIASDLGTTEAVLSGLLNFDGMNTNPARFITRFLITFHARQALTLWYEHAYWFNTNWQKTGQQISGSSSVSYPLFDTIQNGHVDINGYFASAVLTNKNLINAQILTLLNQNYYFTNAETLPKLKKYEGNIVRYLGKYYKLKIVESGNSNVYHQSNFAFTSFSSLEQVARDTPQPPDTSVTLNSNGRYDYLESYAKRVYIQMEEISDSETIPQIDAVISSNRKVTDNQQFDLICVPADTMELIYDDNGTPTSFETNGDYARRVLSEYALQEDANVYDIQLLPYCPISYLENGIQIEGTEGVDFNYITSSGPDYIDVEVNVGEDNSNIYVSGTIFKVVTAQFSNMQVSSGDAVTIDEIHYEILSEEFNSISVNSVSIDDTTGIMSISYNIAQASNITDDEAVKVVFSIKYHYQTVTNVKNVIFYCNSASFQQQLDYQLGLIDSMKIDSQCEMYRLLSPNYQGVFEFNVAKNGGSVNFFTAYCTYKPYTPFIKVCPELNFVYGMDYNDNRGLICGGDFSLPRISSAWQSYQLNNKNYQNIFNRDIQNLDLMQSIEARQQYITGGLGIASDAMKGAITGGMLGKGWGAVAGGLIGAGASAVGYGIDIGIMAKQHQEAKSYAIDKYNYQLGNIKALPYTLTKVGAFDISSKIFPVLEHYSCSEQEKQALKQKIKYESMTIMAIGLFGDYYRAFDELKYFKGELIRCDDIADDSHVLDAIYAELLKGVYM